MPTLLRVLRLTWARFAMYGDTLAAATAFYMLLSAAPLVMISVAVAGLVFDQATAREGLLGGLRRFASDEVLRVATYLLDSAAREDTTLATALATLMLLWASSRLFVQMQSALNFTWGVQAVIRTTRDYLEYFVLKRGISLAMVLGCGVFLIASLVVQTAVGRLGQLAGRAFGMAELPTAVLLLKQTALSFGLLAVLLAVLYCVLPDARVRVRDVWLGALLTSALTLLGTRLLGYYFAHVAPTWLQGALGSAAVLLLWTYYLAQVFYLGACFTREWSRRNGEQVTPRSRAEVRPSTHFG